MLDTERGLELKLEPEDVAELLLILWKDTSTEGDV